MPPDYEIADVCLAVLATLTFFVTAWRMADGFDALAPARWLLLVGWGVLAVRLWWAILVYGDAPIHPVSLLALTLIALANSLLQITRERVREALRRLRGRR